MSILSDGEIGWYISEGLLKIEPEPGPDQLQPASVDLRLGSGFREFMMGKPISSRDETKMRHLKTTRSILVKPGGFLLAHTEEKVTIPANLVGVVDGRSSLGRLGIMVHITAGYIDPGFSGQITLEIHNVSPNSVQLFVGDRVCQVRFHQMRQPSNKPYSGKYQGNMGAVESQISKDHLGLRDDSLAESDETTW